jgi:hypothetical protein
MTMTFSLAAGDAIANREKMKIPIAIHGLSQKLAKA